MKFLSKNRYISLILTLPAIVMNAQFAPPAGVQGTTAIHKDSSIFVNWATSCEVELGTEDISNPQSPIVSTGDQLMAIGEPGSGVVSLGDGGYAILSFENKIINGPGWDFAIFENAFSNNFLELAFVEVSSNGVDYFRFPATSLTQDTIQIGPFDDIQDAEKINNLAGKYRANYGTPFDLDELSEIENLDVNAISHVKLIDVVGSINDGYCSFDNLGNKINDPFPTPFPSSGFDLDAIGVINELPLGFYCTFDNNKTINKIILERDFIDLKFQNKNPQLFSFNIVNINGQILIAESNYLNESNSSKIIPISKLRPGLYILNLSSDLVSKSIKFIKQ